MKFKAKLYLFTAVFAADGWKYLYFIHTTRGFQQSHQCSSLTKVAEN